MAVLTNIPNNTSARDWRDTMNSLIKRVAALEAAGVQVVTPAPAFTTQPSITPTSGTAGSTVYAATPGTVSNGSVVSRAWLLNGTAISTGVTALPASSGTLAYQETASGPGGTTTSTVQVAAVTAATVTPAPAPSFISQPSISPNTGTAGATTFTATAGNVSNGSITARSWTINGTVISTGLTASPASSGTLTYQETATGPGGSAQSTVQQVTVATAAASAPAFTSQPTVSPSTGTAGTTTYTAAPGAVSNGTITSRAWSLNGSVISTGLTAAPASAGTLTYQEFATGAGGSASSSVLTRTVSAASPAPSPTLLLSSAVAKSEGNSGTTAFVWTLTLNRDGSADVFPFTWAVTGSGSNPANAADFGGTLPSGSGTFAAGETSKTITVLAAGDTAIEPVETFLLTVNATGLASVTSTGTINNDDASGGQAGVLQSIGIMTDLDSDVDDVVAIALAINMAENAGLSVSYLSVGSRHEYSAHAGRVLLNAANRASVPVCQIQTPELANSGSKYVTEVANLFQPVKLRAEYPSSVSVTRAALAAMPDKSHKIVTMGCLTDYAALLASPADSISPLTGTELVRAKVISVHPMAGTYPNSTDFGPNTNDDWEASNATARGPVPVYWAIGPLGPDVYTSIPSNGIAATDPYSVSMISFNGKVDGPDRASWDSMPVMHAILGEEPHFVKSEPQDVDFTVGTAWTANPAGNNYYLTRKVSADVLRDYIDWNVNAFMVKYGQKAAPIAPVAAQSAAQAPNLQAEWPFYETSGQTAASLTGKHGLTLNGDARLQAFPARLVSINKTGVSSAAPPSEDFGGYAGLFVAVVNFRQLFATCTIMSQDASTQSTRAWAWRTNGNKLELFWRGGAGVTITDTTAQVVNKWCSVAVLIRPDRSVMFYTNGVAGGGGTLMEGAISPTAQSFVVASAMKGWMAYGAVHKGEVSDAYVQAQLQRARDVAATKSITLP